MVKKDGLLPRLGTLALFILACESAGILGSLFTIQSIPAWYAALIKPPFAPPNWLFAPVWTILYALMGIAAFLVWEKKKGAKAARASAALNMFGIQLALNALWSVVFFGLRSPLIGLLIIILMLIAIALTMWRFYFIDKRAFWLMAPYLLWVSFATLLNFYIFALNP
jgi:tryptophan-rich sensory protein